VVVVAVLGVVEVRVAGGTVFEVVVGGGGGEVVVVE